MSCWRITRLAVFALSLAFFGLVLASYAFGDEVPSSVEPSNSTSDGSTTVQVVTLEDARLMVDYALAESSEIYVDRVGNEVAVLGDQVMDLGKRMDGIDVAIGTISRALADDGKKSSEQSTAVVVIDGEQWSTIQRCWTWAKSVGSILLFVMLACTLFVCVLIGQRLWDAFSRGWRQ